MRDVPFRTVNSNREAGALWWRRLFGTPDQDSKPISLKQQISHEVKAEEHAEHLEEGELGDGVTVCLGCCC